MTRDLLLAVATDIHSGFDDFDRLGSKIGPHNDQFMQQAESSGAHAAIVMGDLVSARSADRDSQFMSALCATFKKASLPFYFAAGNNDIKNLTREEFSRITGSPGESYSIDINDHHIVILNPDVSTYGERGPSLKERNTLEWLKDDLAATNKDTIVVSHIALSNQSQDKIAAHFKLTNGNELQIWYHYPEAEEAREIMVKSGRVKLCLAGHGHRDEHKVIDGIHYIMQQSMAQAGPDRTPIGRFSLMNINDRQIDLRWYGQSPPPYTKLDL